MSPPRWGPLGGDLGTVLPVSLGTSKRPLRRRSPPGKGLEGETEAQGVFQSIPGDRAQNVPSLSDSVTPF